MKPDLIHTMEQSETILIVDDSEENRELLAEMLSPDYKIVTTGNGFEALAIACSDTPPDLILLDIMMPGMDGYEVCRRLKANVRSKDIPVIFLTAMNEADAETRGFAIGAVDYITKPFNMSSVNARARTHLELKNKRMNLEKRTLELIKTMSELNIRNRFIRQTFGRYLSDDIVDRILESPEGVNLGGEKRELSILVSDIRGFTFICEQLPAEDVVGIINIYLEVMTEVILKYQGSINEFIGDAILVFFGALVSRPDDVERAIACAMEMQLAMEEVNRRCREKNYPEVKQGIAVNTGRAVVGNIGSNKRIKYGVVGSAVNLTFRVQSYTMGGQIFISENTMEACRLPLRIDDRQEVHPKGVRYPINIYEIGGIGGDFNLYLPEKQETELIPLPNPIPILYHFITESQILDKTYPGELLKVNGVIADVQVDRSFRRHTSLKITMIDAQGQEMDAELYARVVAKITGYEYVYRVNFTSVPPNATDYWEKNIAEGSPQKNRV